MSYLYIPKLIIYFFVYVLCTQIEDTAQEQQQLSESLTDQYSCAPVSSGLCVCVWLCVCLSVCLCVRVCVCMCAHLCVCVHEGPKVTTHTSQDLLTLVSAPTLKESHTSERIVVSPGRSARPSYGS